MNEAFFAGADGPEPSPSGEPIYHHDDAAALELASGDGARIATIAGHIERHLGPVSGVHHELLSDGGRLEVHVVPPSAEFPFYTLVTSGMSDRPMAVPPGAPTDEAPPYAELCLLLPSTWHLPEDLTAVGAAFEEERAYWPIRWLKMLARLPHEYGTWLGFGHTVPNGEAAEPFADNTELGCLLVLTALSLPAEFQTLVVSPAKTVQFYTLYPIYHEEMELKMAQGVDALLDRFEVYDTSDVLDLRRPNTALG